MARPLNHLSGKARCAFYWKVAGVNSGPPSVGTVTNGMKKKTTGHKRQEPFVWESPRIDQTLGLEPPQTSQPSQPFEPSAEVRVSEMETIGRNIN